MQVMADRFPLPRASLPRQRVKVGQNLVLTYVSRFLHTRKAFLFLPHGGYSPSETVALLPAFFDIELRFTATASLSAMAQYALQLGNHVLSGASYAARLLP